MMNSIISLLLGTLIYFILSLVAYWWTDVKKWTLRNMNYQPWTCFKCFRFWLCTYVVIIIALIPEYYLALTLFVLACLDTIALHVKEKNGEEV